MKKQSSALWIGLLVTVMVLGSAASESRAAAAKYPTKSIQLVVCFSPGSTDLAVRPFTEKLPQYLGQQMVFVYKPGAGGATGASFVAKSRPDGYTLVVGPQAPFITCPLTMDLDYTIDDLIPISQLTSGAMGIAVKADSPLKTVKDLIEAAKKAPGKLTYCTPGVYTTQHMALEVFAREAGITLTHVPTTGGNPAAAAVLGGHATMTSSTMPAITPHVKSGAFRMLVVYEKKRMKEFPDVPTFVELGFPQVVFFNWFGVMAPKGTPKEVISTVNAAFKKVVDENGPLLDEQIGNLSMRVDYMGPEQFYKSVRAEYEVRKAILKDLMKTMK